MSEDVINDIKWQLSSYRTNKILAGRGLEDDPEWVVKYEELVEAHRD
jgi:hypothetical protein